MNSRKQRNLDYAIQKLNEYSIEYSSRNDGLHLKIETGNEPINFYPTTGRFMHLNYVGFGVSNLIKYIEQL